LNDDRLRSAERSLCDMLECNSLEGLSFLDLGSGSGLFSLAAVRLGATRVHSLDIDPQSVGCALALRRQFAPSADNWNIEEASVLDRTHIDALGQFDVVYAWGVLHHTGAMRVGLENAGSAVAAGGRLFIAIYNDQGARSRRWRAIKRLYNRLPA